METLILINQVTPAQKRRLGTMRLELPAVFGSNTASLKREEVGKGKDFYQLFHLLLPLFVSSYCYELILGSFSEDK